MQTVHLDAEKFEELIRCLSNLKDNCNDVDIREGIIRQKTNNHTVIFEIDMTALLADLSIPLATIKQKLDLFKMFSEQEVEIKVEDSSFTFSDSYSSLTFKTPNLEFLDNKFMSSEELGNMFETNEPDLILNCDLPQTISERVKIVTQVFNVTAMQVVLSGSTAAISAGTQAKDQFAKFLSDLTTDREMEASSSLVVTPFIIDHDDTINFKMYNNPDDEANSNISVNMFSTSISDVEIKVYSRSTLTELESDGE